MGKAGVAGPGGREPGGKAESLRVICQVSMERGRQETPHPGGPRGIRKPKSGWQKARAVKGAGPTGKGLSSKRLEQGMERALRPCSGRQQWVTDLRGQPG